MNIASSTSDEIRRLEVLRSYEILDTAPELALDELTKLAATICEAPVALISLVDGHRQWFKSRVGLEVTETPRDVAFSAHALQQPGLFIVPDAMQDARFAQNPLVTGEPRVRFYAGAPLVTPEGASLGTLCVIDRQPRTLTPLQEQTLRVLGRQVMTYFELRRHTRELMESEERQRSVMESALDAIVTIDHENRITDFNPAAEKTFGWRKAEVLGRNMADTLIPPAFREAHRRGLARYLETGATVIMNRRIEVTAVRSDGTELQVELTVARLGHSTPPHFTAFLRDITERKQAEAQLRLLETCVERLNDIVLITEAEPQDEPGPRILYVNEAFVRRTGYTREEVLGKSPRFLQGPKTSRTELDRIHVALKAWQPVRAELINYTKSGEEFWLEIDIVPVADAKGWFTHWVAVERDITERKRTEQALRESEERYRTLFEYAPDGIIMANPEEYYIDANASVCRMLGYTHEELIGRHAADIVARREIVNIEPALSMIKAHADYHQEWQFRRKDGHVFAGEVFATLMPDGNVLAMIRDISERKEAERALRASEKKYRGLFEGTRDAVMTLEPPGGMFTSGNPAAVKMFGARDEEELVALGPGEVSPEMQPDGRSSAEKAGEVIEKTMHEGSNFFEWTHRRIDGVEFVTDVLLTRVQQGGRAIIHATLRDISERKKLEEQSLRSQRMESIGTLAGGIAHDLNNSLGPIIMSLDLLQMKFTDPASQELLAIIGASAQRGADMVRQVLSFGRGVEGRRMEVQIKHLVREVEKIATDTFLKNIQIRTIIPHDLWTVIGDPTQLHQVLLNLCVNARDAMPSGGTLTISAKNLTLDAHYAGLSPEAKAGPYVFLQVEDSGTGMPPEVMDKIFDPFFTTKEIGKGTGLGLSTSLGIVKSHGGFIQVSSELEEGTKFKVYLPAQTITSPEAMAETAAEMPRGHGEWILVVDDEVAVRLITQQTLEAFGYRVILAADGAEAVSVFAQKMTQIAAVVTDMMMPGIDGPATIQILRKMNPRLPIIATSGLADNEHITRTASLGVKHFLTKPFTAETLLKTLRDVLAPG